MSEPSSKFPWWIPVGAAVLALGYVRTLAAPFDFIDDGNLVYPAPAGTSLGGHARLWWESVVANVEHLGPFRPTLWAQWHAEANLFGGDPVAWRTARLLWFGLAAGMFLWLMRELRIPAVAALFATAAAMWNPYRGEIWTSLTLSEGVAMPYALFALVAARKAASANRPIWWDIGGVAAALFALGCKNTFAALLPAQVALRMCQDGLSLREAWRTHGIRAAALALTFALPAGHFVYFKLNWHPGQYQPHAPSLAQLGRVLSALKGGMGLDFLGVGMALTAVAVTRGASLLPEFRAAAVCAVLLTAAGVAVYLPMDAMSGRYTMPAAWGLDVAFALALTALLRLPPGVTRTAAGLALSVGLVALMAACLNRQEKVAARAEMLWQVVHHLETHAPPGAGVVWVSGDAGRGELDVEEGIHVGWHLANRGRPDIHVALVDAAGRPVARVELSDPAAEPLYRVTARPKAEAGAWEPDHAFTVVYQFGRKRYDCVVARRPAPHFAAIAAPAAAPSQR